MRKHFHISILFLFVTQIGFGQGFNVNPAVGIREFAPGVVNRSVYDPVNDIVYVTGTYDAASASLDFDPDPGNVVTLPAFGPAGTVDVFIATYSSTGVLFGAIGFGGDGNDYSITLDFDASGNIYVGGTFGGTAIDIDPGVGVQSISNFGGFDGFAVVLDQFGNFVQGYAVNSAGGDAVRGIKIDSFGDIVLLGNFNDNMFYERYAGNLTIAPDISFVVPGATARELLLDSNDDIIACGIFSGTVDFDPDLGITNRISNGLNDYFIAKYNGFDGSLISAQSFGGAGDDLLRRVAIGPNDEIIFSGIFNVPFDADPSGMATNLTTNGGDDFFISKFNSNETLAWSFSFGGIGNDNVNGLYVNSFGSVFAAGKFNGTIDFDPGSGTSQYLSTADDGYLFKLNSNGTFGSAVSIGNSGIDAVQALVAIDDAVSISFASFSTQNADLDPNCSVVTLTEYNYGWLGYQDVSIVGVPASQPTGLNFTATATTVTGTFTPAVSGPSGYLVLMSAGQLPDIDPADGQDYCIDDQLGLNGAGQIIYVVANGQINQFTTVGHSPGEQLFYKVFSYNGFGKATNYNTTSPLAGSTTTPLVAAIPSIQASNLSTPSPSDNQVTINWTRGNGNNVLVVMREGNAVDAFPALGQTYSFSTVFGSGPAEIGTGNYVVYNGTASSVTVTNLIQGTTYHIQAFEYSGTAGTENYLTATATGNPSSFTTTSFFATEPTVQASNFMYASGANTYQDISWNRGNGSALLIVAKSGSAVDQFPADGISYTANDIFGLGSDLGGGNYVVFNGTGTSLTLNGLIPATDYHLLAFEYNGSGGTENYLTSILIPTFFTTSNTCSGDTSPPAIAHTQPTSVDLNGDLTINVNVTDPDGCPINYVDIYYSALDALDLDNPVYKYGSMQQASAGSSTYTITISGEASNLGVEYFFEAADDAGNVKYDDFYYNVPVSVPDGGYTIPYSSYGSTVNNYRIISVPLTNNDAAAEAVFDELGAYDRTKWRMYQYSGGNTSEIGGTTSLTIGRGYWLIIRANPGVALTAGGGRTAIASYTDPYVINLTAGWNLIGNPFPFDIDWSDLIAYNNDPSFTPDLKVYKGSGSYTNGTELEKFSGGFVLSTGAYQLQIPAYRNPTIQGGRTGNSNAPSRTKNTIDQPNWEVPIIVSNGKIENTFGGVGMNGEASEYFDSYDELTLPRFLDYVEIVHDNPKKFDSYFSRDIVPTADSYIWEFKVESNAKSTVGELKWDNDYFGDNNKQLYLWDNQLQRSIDMRSVTHYIFDQQTANSFRVIYGDADFVKEQTDVKQIVLHQVSPNPATDEVVISFSVPQSTENIPVRLQAIDLMGRSFWNSEQLFSSGYHEVKWKINSKVAAGMYLIQVKSGKFSDQKRLIVNR